MKRSMKRAIEAEAAQAAHAKRRPKSKYARKASYLRAHGGWGWEYGQDGEGKPWKGKLR